MPTYVYRCSSCENQYEMREGFDAPSRQPCPRCGEVAKRVLHAPPIVFKGSGFYITDSRKGSSATLADNGGTPGASPSPSSTSSESKSDSAATATPAAATDD